MEGGAGCPASPEPSLTRTLADEHQQDSARHLGPWRQVSPAQFQGCSYSGFLLHPGHHTSTTWGASWQKHQNIKSKPRSENQHRGLQKTHQGAELCWCFSTSVFVSFTSLCVFHMTHSTAVLHSASSLTKGPSLSTSRMIFLVKISCVMR